MKFSKCETIYANCYESKMDTTNEVSLSFSECDILCIE